MSKTNSQVVIDASEISNKPSLPLRTKVGLGLGIAVNAVVDATMYTKDKTVEASIRGRICATDVKETARVAIQAGKAHRAEVRGERLSKIEELKALRASQLEAIQAVKNAVK